MRDAIRALLLTATLLATVAMVATAPAVAQSDGTLDLTVSADDATAGENATVSYTVENTGDEPVAVVLDVTDVPEGWTVQAHADDGGNWRQDGKWLFQTVEAGDSVEPSVTFGVPEDASGEYTIGGNASTAASSTTAEATFSVATPTSSGSGPGFGVAVTTVALLAVALLARRQH
jgi:PGF-CTERM protein